MPYQTAAGQTLYYTEQGRGMPLLLLHGFGETGRDLAPLRRAWRAQWRLCTPDLPGQGRSQPQPRAFPDDFYAQDARVLAAFLDARGLARVAVAGFSDGAEVALWLAILRPAQVYAVVAWGVAGALPPGAAAEIAAVGAVMDAPRPEWRAWQTALRRTYGLAGARALTTGWAAAAARILARGGDISLARAAAIRCPVLLIDGVADPLNPPAAARRLAARIPHAELILVPGAGHAVHRECAPWFTGTVAAWLHRHAP